MSFSLNIPPIVCAVVASMALGAVWYAPMVFGRIWMEAAGISEKQYRETNMAKLLLIQLVLCIVIAALLQTQLRFTTADTLLEGARVALPWWLLITCVQSMHSMYEGGRWKLIGLNAAHEFVNILLMTAILAAWR